MTLHKEGTATIIVATIFIGLINFLGRYFFPEAGALHWLIITLSVALAYIVLQFFRKPFRTAVIDPKQIIAPADGKVVVIEETTESEFFHDRRIQISIFMSPFNVHVNRNPISGIIKYFRYHEGKFLVAWHPKSSTENERTTTVIENGSDQILFRQVAGALAKRIIAYVKEGQFVHQGDDMGFIKFGSRVDIYLPLDAEILVSLNEKASGNQTVIAKLK